MTCAFPYNTSFTLQCLELILLDLPQKEQFVSGIGKRTSRKTLIVKWQDKEGRIGYGECSCRPDPYYSSEFLDGVVLMIQKFIIPQLQSTQTYNNVLTLLQKIRGWNFAKSAIEAAAYQVLQQQTNHSLFDTLHTKPISKIPSGISMGIYTDKHEMKEAVEKNIAAGYRRLKFKISPNTDTDLFDFVNPLLFDSGSVISFDANGSFSHKDLDKFAYFADTYNTVIEQPFSPSRFDIYLAAKERFPNLQVCFDEEVKSMGDVIKLHQLGVLAELNLKVGRVGGITNSIEILQYCHQHQIPCWIGGMFETGIGRLLNLQFASYLPDAVAHDLSPSARYFIEDIIDPPVVMQKGYIDIVEAKKCEIIPELLQKFTIYQQEYKW
ncbi:MAG: o-succinylbenzoate synthase [Chitinophagales bacterium]